MSEIILPTIPHATVTLNVRNRFVVQMNEGWVFYDRNDYAGLTDEEGNPREPYPEEISYYRYGVFAPDFDFTRIVVVDENEVPPYQIFGGGNTEPETEVM
jgi:hypothetical protein